MNLQRKLSFNWLQRTPATFPVLSPIIRRSLITYSLTSTETRHNLLQVVSEIPHREFGAERQLFQSITRRFSLRLSAGDMEAVLLEQRCMAPALRQQILSVFSDCGGKQRHISENEFCAAAACCRLHQIVGVPRVAAAWKSQLQAQDLRPPPFLCVKSEEAKCDPCCQSFLSGTGASRSKWEMINECGEPQSAAEYCI
eukprot:4347134-Pleurochrysis_carterae.AAC.1